MNREHRQLERLLRSNTQQPPNDLVDGIVRSVSAPPRLSRVPVGRRQLTVAIALVLSLVVVSSSFGGFSYATRTVAHAGALFANALKKPAKKDKKTRKRKKAGRTRTLGAVSAITYTPGHWICHWNQPSSTEYNNNSTSRGNAGFWYSDKIDSNPSSIFDYDAGPGTNPQPTAAQCAAGSKPVSFGVSNPGTKIAGQAFNLTVTALVGGVTNNTYTGPHTIAWTGASNSPNGTAPLYPGTSTALTFSTGSATASGITLYKAISTTLTATESSPSTSGNTGAFAVDSAGVTLSFSPSGTVLMTKNVTKTFTILVPNDAYNNVFTSAAGRTVNLSLSSTAHMTFSANGTGSQALTITSGPANNTFGVAESGNNGGVAVTLSGTVAAPFTAPASDTLNENG